MSLPRKGCSKTFQRYNIVEYYHPAYTTHPTQVHTMPAVFQDHDDHFCFGIEDQRNKHDHLPPAVYRLKLHKMPDGASLRLYKSVKTFPLPERRFGRHEKIVKRVLADYDRVNPPLGLMTLGKKGSGKSMLCEDICNRLLAQGMPIIMVDEPVPHDVLLLFAQAVGPSVFYFDEIGKVYPRKGSDDDSNTGLNELLPFFSNQTLIGRVFLITANSSSELNEFFIDRPGRFKYRVEMETMERDAYLEYMQAQNVPPEKLIWLEGVWRYYTFDQLRVVAPALKQSADLKDFLEHLDLLNVQSPYTTTFSLHDLSKHGIPIELEARADIRLDFDKNDMLISLPDDTVRIPWRTDAGTFCEYVHGDRFLHETTIEIGDYTVRFDVDHEGRIPRFEDLLPGTLVRKRPRISIPLKPKKVDKAASMDIVEEPSPLVGRGGMFRNMIFGHSDSANGMATIDG
jgi:hypothetical protein